MAKKSLLVFFTMLIICSISIVAVGCGGDSVSNLSDECEHTNREYVVETAPTMTETGIGYERCSICGKNLKKAILPALNDTTAYSVEHLDEPTCERNGIYIYYYSKEGFDNMRIRVVVDKIDHHYVPVPDVGTHLFRCDMCHKEINAGEHNFGEWQDYTKATCVNRGYKYKECSDCHARITDYSNMTKHDIDPTTRRCKHCGGLESDAVGLTMELTETRAHVVACDKLAVDVVIPEIYKGYTVTSIEKGAFDGCDKVKSIHVADTINIIEDDFAGCTSLEKINIPFNTDLLRSISSNIKNKVEISVPEFDMKYVKPELRSDKNTIILGQGLVTTDSEFDYVPTLGGVYLIRYKGGNPMNVPSEIDGKKVLGVNLIQIDNKDSITHVNIASDTSQELLFYNKIKLPNLKELTTPSHMSHMFEMYDKDQVLDKVTFVGIGYATGRNLNMKELVIGKDINNIYEFNTCTALEKVTIEEGSHLTSIDSETFSKCKNLLSFTIPMSVLWIQENVFHECDRLIIYAERPSKGSGWDDNFSSYYRHRGGHSIPVVYDYKNNYVSNSGAQFFNYQGDLYMQSLNELTLMSVEDRPIIDIPKAVTYDGMTYNVIGIGDEAFFGKEKITQVNIHSGIKEIGEGAFAKMPNLTRINVDANNPYYKMDNGVLVDVKNNVMLAADTKNVVVPSYIKTIGYCAMAFNKVESIVLNEGLQTIENNALEGTLIKEFHAPLGVELSYDVLKNCINVEHLTLPTLDNDMITKLYGTYQNCFPALKTLRVLGGREVPLGLNLQSKLQALYIPNTIKTLYITSTEKLYYAGTLEEYLNIDNIYAYLDGNPYELYINGELLTDFVLPQGISEIKDNAFQYVKFNSVTIDRPISIGRSAFGYGATTYNIHKDIDGQSRFGFNGTIKFTGPASCLEGQILTSIEEAHITKGQTIKNTFFKENLRIATLPDDLQVIQDGNYTSGLFYNCKNLTSIVLPNGLKEIGDNTFSYSGITSIVLPSNLVKIGKEALWCGGIKEVIVPAGTAIIGAGIVGYQENYNVYSMSTTVSDSWDLINNKIYLYSADTPTALPPQGIQGYWHMDDVTGKPVIYPLS